MLSTESSMKYDLTHTYRVRRNKVASKVFRCFLSNWLEILQIYFLKCSTSKCQVKCDHRRWLHRGICPGTHKGTAAKITFCTGNFQGVYNGLNLVTAGHDRLNCAQTRLFGLSVLRPCVDPSVTKCFAAAFTSTWGGCSIQFLHFTIAERRR